MKHIRMRRPNIFAVVETLLTLASLALVAVTMGSQLGAMLGMHTLLGDIVAWAVALVFDALWIGALRMSEQAIRQRSVLGMAVMLGIAGVAVAGSTAILLVMGHVAVFALAPVAAAVFMGLRLFADHTLADTATSLQIAKDSATDRNAAAQARSEARRLRAEAERDVVHETAGHLAEAQRQVVRAEILTKTQKKINKARAEAEQRLTASEQEHGQAAMAFGARTLDVLTEHAPPTAGVTEGVTQVSGQIEAATPEAVTPVSHAETPAAPVAETVAPVATLAEMAAVAGVDTPQPSETLNEAQVELVLRQLRHASNPPRSYRAAVDAFRDAGFIGGEAKIRKAWGLLESKEEEITETDS